MSGVRQISIGAEDADQRLDRWLRRLAPHVTQARIERMCRKGEIRVDGGRVKPATRLADSLEGLAEVHRQDGNYSVAVGCFEESFPSSSPPQPASTRAAPAPSRTWRRDTGIGV